MIESAIKPINFRVRSKTPPQKTDNSPEFSIFAPMNRMTRHIRPVIRFRQWSRKAYAAFASLGREVVISRVGKSITEASLCKVTKYTVREMRHYIPGYEATETEPAPPDIGTLELALMLLVEPTIPAVPAASYLIDNYIAVRPALQPLSGRSAGRIVFIYKLKAFSGPEGIGISARVL